MWESHQNSEPPGGLSGMPPRPPGRARLALELLAVLEGRAGPPSPRAVASLPGRIEGTPFRWRARVGGRATVARPHLCCTIHVAHVLAVE